MNVIINRRAVVAGGLGALATPTILRIIPANAQSKTVKIGFVGPRTGRLAGFGEADGFIRDEVKRALGTGLASGGKTYSVEIITKDSQSTATLAAEAASELILHDKVDLLIASATPDATNPVADQAEANEVPCITTNCPWQPYFFGRNRFPKQGFTWTYHFFWGLEDVIAAYLAILHDTSIKATNNDFTSQISQSKNAGAENVAGNMIVPDFATFWSRAAQQGSQPKIATIGKALLFPALVNSPAPRGNDLSTNVWWTPNYPLKSGWAGQSARDLGDAYVDATKRPWTQPIGYQHALFEAAIDILMRAKSIDPKSILDAIVAANYNAMIGPLKWTVQLPPNLPIGGKLELLS